MSVVVYCRISQDATGQGLGVERQKTECRAWCKSQGWEVGQVYVDNDLSASTGKARPAFESLLADRSNYDGIVVWHTDRLVRRTSDLLRVIDLAVNVHALHAGHLDLSTPAGRAVAKTVTTWAEYESEQKGVRHRAANLQKAQSGRPKWTRRPFGYHMDATVHPIEAEHVRAAYRAILDGLSLHSVCQSMTSAELTTTTGNAWTSTTLRKFLENPRNAGLVVYRGEVMGAGQWQPLVSEEEWRAVVSILDERGRSRPWIGRPSTRLLVGVATCARCDGPLASWARPEGEGGPIYRCIRDHCGTGKVVDADTQVMHGLFRQMGSPAFRQWWQESQSTDTDAAITRANLAEQRYRLDQLAGAFATGAISIQQMTTASATLNAQISLLEKSLASAVQSFPLSDVEGVLDEVLDMPVEQQRTLLGTVFQAILMHPRGNGQAKAPLRMELVPRV